ncbi:endonuclease/exonuclease/phosphatase family protein [Thalassotalea hakodatensis]|uniref:endonuclease/exonuclease/phosphatase family protein n=1 Tax=Thalassotalea hakodatensis TaxID=3030492 RepID=UPI0025737396|nr:endonuclease/exonuclease/phosphatase family protein [Thalassotalea hakodatensis]
MKLLITITGFLLLMSTHVQAKKPIRVATFNVSMEALNYIQQNDNSKVTGTELLDAMKNEHQQIKNIAEIIQRVNPDILLINEIDNHRNVGREAMLTFMDNFLSVGQNGQQPIHYSFSYQSPVNTGVLLPADANGDGKITHPSDTHGFGYFPGQYSMAIMSRYPIDAQYIRTFQKFKWSDMPGALKPVDPKTGEDYYSKEVWQALRLSSKTHWDIPIRIYDTTLHVLASHPTPPVFDGPEDRNGKRNHDEIRFWHDYITPGKSDYIYDDNKKSGGLNKGDLFVIAGDLNASPVEGDAINSSISALIDHPNVQDPKPSSNAASQHSPDNKHAANHTAYWRMRADYLLPSKHGFKVVDSGVFWPEKNDDNYRLIESRKASSDHRLVWIDILLTDY